MKDEKFELPIKSEFDYSEMEKQVQALLDCIKREYSLPKNAVVKNFRIDYTLKKCRKVCVVVNGRRFCICI